MSSIHTGTHTLIYIILILLCASKQECACTYEDSSGGEPVQIVLLQDQEFNGVWSVNGPRSWEGCYYVYEVSVYYPSTSRIEKCIANDPYARGYAGCPVSE